jgi:hypothetical protein
LRSRCFGGIAISGEVSATLVTGRRALDLLLEVLIASLDALVEPEETHLGRDRLLVLGDVRLSTVAALALILECLLPSRVSDVDSFVSVHRGGTYRIALLATARKLGNATTELRASVSLGETPVVPHILGNLVGIHSAAWADARGQVARVVLGICVAREGRRTDEKRREQHGGCCEKYLCLAERSVSKQLVEGPQIQAGRLLQLRRNCYCVGAAEGVDLRGYGDGDGDAGVVVDTERRGAKRSGCRCRGGHRLYARSSFPNRDISADWQCRSTQ